MFKNRHTYKIFRPFIEKDVQVMSEMLVTLSQYFKYKCEFMCTEKGKLENPDFFKTFNKNSMREVYMEMRDGKGLHDFDLVRTKSKSSKPTDYKGRSRLIDNMLAQYSTNVQTNLSTHIRRHLINYYCKEEKSQ